MRVPIAPKSPLIEMSGSPRERGRQHGEQAADRVKLGIEHYSSQIAASRLSWDDIAAIAAQFEPKIAAFDPTYVDEMRGIAEGAGVPFAGVVLLNARTEMLKLAVRRARGEPPPGDPDGC